MKIPELTFKREIKVFQVFRSINYYGKIKKSFNDRNDKIDWNDMPSKSGHVLRDELYLPERILNSPDFITCDLITLEDSLMPTSHSESDLKFTQTISSNLKPATNRCFHLNRSCKLDIFEIKSKEDIELHLQYGHFEVGIPERENFKLCEIKKDKPVEIKINGKTDFSLSSRRERLFKEQTYIFNYLGDFATCKILKEPFDYTVKHIPKNRKVVDLIKPLW